MPDIKIREEKIKERRKTTIFRDFVREICSRYPATLYKREGLISKFPDIGRVRITDVMNFEKWRDGLPYLEYDQTLSLFDNIAKLYKIVELPNLFSYGSNENANFTDLSVNSKNIHLSFLTVDDCENICYAFSIKGHCRNIFNSTAVLNYSENVYFGEGIVNSSRIFFSKFIINSFDVRFSTNLTNCQNCIFCDNLENASYCIHNKQLTKEDFLKEKEKILAQKNKFLPWYQELPFQGNNIGSHNVRWSFVQDSDSVEDGYLCYQIKNWRNIVMVGWEGVNENMYDVCSSWAIKNNDFYATSWAGIWSQNVFCSWHISWANIYYSYYTDACSYCLGCIWLKNKSFCILNKQYTKEARLELADKIFAQMDADWSLWAFFPWWLSPFYFNDTMAYLVDDSFTKDEVAKEWYMRREEKITVDIPAWVEVIEVKDLSLYQWFDEQWKRKINPDILKKVIKDTNGDCYRIVPMELDFLQKHWLPLPELHWLERIKLWFKFK